jgi:hypothetical protein
MAYERLDKKYKAGQVWDEAAISHIDDGFEDVNNAIQTIHDQLNPIIGCGVASTSDYSIQGFMRPAGTINTSNGYVRTDYIDLQNCSEITVYCKPQALTVSPVVWFDVDKNYISGETATEITEQVLTYQVPSGACFAVFSTASTGTRKVDGVRKLTKFEYLTEKTITQAWVTDKDGSGFSSQGESASIYCISCLAEGCIKGFRCLGTNSIGTFINCVSKNNAYPFVNGTQLNCVTLTE